MKLEDLDELIPQYAMNKNEFESYKQICNKENAQIKAIMDKFSKNKYSTKDYTATYSVSEREQFNEEMLLTFFTSVPDFVSIANTYGIVKTKKYIDYDALEKALYNEALTENQVMEIDRARETKEVITLRVTKNKKED